MIISLVYNRSFIIHKNIQYRSVGSVFFFFSKENSIHYYSVKDAFH